MRTIEDLDAAELAVLCREWLLCGHLIDRSGMAHVLAGFGLDGMRDIAIDEWMGASPVYTRRMQRLLGFEGDDVTTIFKGMQFDIGAPPGFMDFRYRVRDAGHGEFWLDHCGALMDVEPMGAEYVVNMCHHIEDPTFDATAAATNGRARMRPIHRPPREPSDRHPHCHWEVTIDPGADPLPEPEQAERIGGTRAAKLPLHARPGAGRYDGPLQPDVDLVALGRDALLGVAEEVALQGQLLTLSFADAVERRSDAATAVDIVTRQFIGIAGVAAERIRRAFDITDLATLVALHPAFHPGTYIDVTVGDDETLALGECAALGDRPGFGWADVLDTSGTQVLSAVVHVLDAAAHCVPDGPRRWRVEHLAEPRRRSREVAVTRYSTGADFVLEDRT